jgi:dTDP-4-dehydrorhamnose reductase
LKKKLLITGGSGYLGRHLTAKALEDFEVYTTYTFHAAQIKAGQALPLDLTNREAVLSLIASLSPQAIIHAAAVNPGRGDDEEMWQVNAHGSRYVAEGAVAVGARLIHVSTDVVHDGRHAPYADAAPPSPINGYGRSKAEAEAAIAEIDPTAAIVRTSLIYGLAEMDRGTAEFVKRLAAGQPLLLFSDVIRQPIWVESLAAALLKLIELNFSGTLNVAGRQALTREEFGRRMLAWWGIDAHGFLQSGRAAEISDTIPLDLRLRVDKAEQLLQMMLPGVDEVLAIGKRQTY